MKNKYKLLISVLVVTLLMTGVVAASSNLRFTSCMWSSNDPDMATCHVCHYNKNSDKDNCKSVYHKLSWFEKKLINWIPGWPFN
ncbi:hypothetical protein ES703_117824 [subsurface metagenome]